MIKHIIVAILFLIINQNISSGNLHDLFDQMNRISNQQPVIERSLKRLGDYELRILRNSIFALHGRSFISNELDSFFYKNINSLYGFNSFPRFDFNKNKLYSLSLLSNIDHENLDLIIKQELQLDKSWMNNDKSLEEVLDSYQLDNEDVYSTMRRPNAYKFYPDHSDLNSYFILIEEPRLYSDVYRLRTFYCDAGDYSVLDFNDSVGGVKEFYSEIMLLFYDRNILSNYSNYVRIDMDKIITELYKNDISVISTNANFFRKYHYN